MGVRSGWNEGEFNWDRSMLAGAKAGKGVCDKNLKQVGEEEDLMEVGV